MYPNNLSVVVPMRRVEALVGLLTRAADFVHNVYEFRLHDANGEESLPFSVLDYDEMEDLEGRLRESIRQWARHAKSAI